jgi:NitT/TauT family transport system substrate-binding protein
VISLAVAHARGLPLTVAAPASLYNSKAPTSVLMVANGSPIATARDCTGKTIGVSSLKSITQYSTEAWLDAHGGDAKSVKFIELGFPEMAPALAQGRIDIGHFAEPFLSDAKKSAHVLGDSYDAVASNFMISVYVTTPAFAGAHPDVVKRFADAMRETAAWANAHHAESAPILADAAKMDLATVTAMTRATYAERLSAADLQPNIDVTARYGGLAAFPATALLPNA